MIPLIKHYRPIVTSMGSGLVEVSLPLMTFLHTHSLIITALSYGLFKVGALVSVHFQPLRWVGIGLFAGLILLQSVNIPEYLIVIMYLVGGLWIGVAYRLFSEASNQCPKPGWWKTNTGSYLMMAGLIIGSLINTTMLFAVAIFWLFNSQNAVTSVRKETTLRRTDRSALWLRVFAFSHQFQYQMFSSLLVVKFLVVGMPIYLVGLAFCGGWILYIPGKKVGDWLQKYIRDNVILIVSYLLSIPWLVLLAYEATPWILTISYMLHGLTISLSRVYRNLATSPRQVGELFEIQQWAAFLGPWFAALLILTIGDAAPFWCAALVMAGMILMLVFIGAAGHLNRSNSTDLHRKGNV